MMDSRRPAGVSVRLKAFAMLPVLIVTNDEVARDQVNFLPIIMYKWFGGKNSWLKPQETRTASTPRLFIEFPRKNLLLDTAGITEWSSPPIGHVE
jgi:hypothetical protein